MGAFTSLAIAPELVEPVEVPFGEWLPDMAALNSPGSPIAQNVIPQEGFYGPFKDLSLHAGLVLPAASRGGLLMEDVAGNPQLYGATVGGIYARQGSAWTQVYAAPMSLYEEYYWQFVPFGDSIVALHPELPPVVGDVGGYVAWSPLGGDPPIARTGSRVGDFLVLGNLDSEPDTVTRQPRRVRWSAFNNIEAPWTTSATNQSDFQDMPAEGGEVMAITGREYGTVFQRHAISRMSYVGLPTVFDIDTVEQNRGALCSGGVIDIGPYVYFIADDGFFVWNGTNAQPIGNNKVNRWFFNLLNYPQRFRIVGAVDYVNSCVMWAFPTATNALSHIIIFSYKEQRWSYAVRTTEYIFSSATLAASLDDLGGSIDAMALSFDDASYRGGRLYMAGFDGNHAYGLFNGSALAATLDTAEANGPGGTRVFANSARPLVDLDAATATIQAAARDQLQGGALTYGAAVAQEINGECPILVDGRFVRFRVNVPAAANWTSAQGVQIWRKKTGRV